MATETTIEQTNDQDVSLWKFVMGGVLAGLITGIINNVWILAFPYVSGIESPGGINAMSVSVLSFVPVFLASLVYYGLSLKSIKKGTKIYLIIGIIGFLASLYGPLNPDVMTDLIGREIMKEGLALFALPMHVISAASAMLFLPKFVLSE
jgi:hypothetical protein